MIAYLKGEILQKSHGRIVLLVSGTGYEVRISNYTYEKLPSAGTACELQIHHHFSDNEQQLFGFHTLQERELFELLITVKGIGPRLALALLSSMPPDSIIETITHQNASLIAKSPGIGKKSAERIVLELRDKLGAVRSDSGTMPETGTVQSEAISALESLGYARAQAIKAVRRVAMDPSENNIRDSVSDLVKSALKLMQ